MSLRLLALGFAMSEYDQRVAEDGENTGERIRRYLENTDPPIPTAAPWCAAFIQYVTDVPALYAGSFNPLNDVRQEALVESYVAWAVDEGLEGLRAWQVRSGDLVAFQFGASRWNHLGIVVRPPDQAGQFVTIEGNTSPGVGLTDEEREREGEGVYQKERWLDAGYGVSFLRFPP